MNIILKILFVVLIIAQAVSAQVKIEKSKVALLMSSEESFLSTEYEKHILEQITAWEYMLMDNKINYDVITPDEIDNSIIEKYACLIVATNLFLNEDKWNELYEYTIESGKFFIAASISVRGENTVLTNHNAIQKLTGVSSISPVSESVRNIMHVFTGKSQLTKNINPGDGLLLSANSEIYYTDYSYSDKNIGYLKYPSDALESSNYQHSAIYYGANDKTKFVWCGFSPFDIIGGKAEQKIFSQFVINSINWLKGEQYSAIDQWHSGKNSAFVLAPIVNGRIDITDKLISVISDSKINADFMVTEKAVNDSALLHKLTPYGNFGLYVNDLSSNSDKVISLINELKNNTSSEIEYIGTNDIASVALIKNELIEAGVKVVALINYQKTLTPFFLDDEQKLLIIPAAYSSIGDEANIQLLHAGLASHNTVYKDGINFWIPDLKICNDKTKNEIKNYLDNLSGENSKTKSGSLVINSIDAYDWFHKKAEIKSRVISQDNSNFEIELKNGNSSSVDSIVIAFADAQLNIEPILYENGKVSDLHFEYDKYENKIRIYVDSLKPYKTKRIKISTNEIL